MVVWAILMYIISIYYKCISRIIEGARNCLRAQRSLLCSFLHDTPMFEECIAVYVIYFWGRNKDLAETIPGSKL
jgi:hypothetical protein